MGPDIGECCLMSAFWVAQFVLCSFAFWIHVQEAPRRALHSMSIVYRLCTSDKIILTRNLILNKRPVPLDGNACGIYRRL
ncbi:hypothetical protein BJX70DRAFT_365307 [Aspergillus crustosus]